MESSKSQNINNNENNGRREFLKKTWKILGLIAAAELAFFTFSLLRPAKNKKAGTESNAVKILGNVDDFKSNTVTANRANKLFLVREPDGGFLALSLICSHLGCSVSWDETKSQFICPCHSSAFDKYGNVINSPAPRPLDYFPVRIEQGKIKVDLSQKTKRKKFEKNQLTYAV